MRAADQPAPAVVDHVYGPDAPIYGWPYRPVIALEYLPAAAYTWDDPDPEVVWGSEPTSNVVLVEPFDNLTAWTLGSGGTITAGGQVGTFLRTSGGAKRGYPIAAASRSPWIDVEFWWRCNNIGTVQTTILTVRSASDIELYLTVATNGGYTITRGDGVQLGASSAGLAVVNTWYRLHFTAYLAVAASGWARLDVAGTNRIDVSGVQTYRTTSMAHSIYTDNVSGLTEDYDELVLITGEPSAGVETPYVWDDELTASGFTDVACDFHGVTIEPADPDELGVFGSTQCNVTLDNRDGAYTPYLPDGRLVYWAPGRRLQIGARRVADGTWWWLFAGKVTAWTVNADHTVTITAFDGFAELNEPRKPAWTAGTAGQTALARIQAVATAAGYTDPIGGDTGDVALTVAATAATPLEECQRIALSDGGVFAADADGTLLYRNRLWRAGRADQPARRAFTDNICDGPLVVWDPELAADDFGLFTRVELVNVAGLVSTAAVTAPTLWADRRYTLTHPDPDRWTTQTEGDTLAAYLLAHSSTPAIAVRQFTLYVNTPAQDLWAAAIDLRRGDRFDWITVFPSPAGDDGRLELTLIAVGVAHEITPETWVATVTGTRTVDWRLVEEWDETVFAWDAPDAANVWRY